MKERHDSDDGQAGLAVCVGQPTMGRRSFTSPAVVEAEVRLGLGFFLPIFPVFGGDGIFGGGGVVAARGRAEAGGVLVVGVDGRPVSWLGGESSGQVVVVTMGRGSKGMAGLGWW
ncbi:leucine-rich repeat extensin-like protein 3 [Iris pallida]|uniref:Leucine-rich repeat extensin-like protein 3 n=1 Tax=Iris pallida TaxID=29817 RepID=A0AAX6FS00_IRIPA|nr:leucine-rich repeat extensin-like protein 3 [Iris pallida]